MDSRLSRLSLALATVALAAAVRLARADAVLREDTVLAGNDAWHYRHQVHAIRDGATTAGDAGGEPLYYWLATQATRVGDFAGISVDATLAVLPVILGVATVAACGWLAQLVSADRRVPVLSMALLAVYPGHVRYTSVGVADHHALDYLLLALALVALVSIVQAGHRRERGIGAGGLALAVAAAVLAWDGAPVLLVPVVAGTAAVVWRRDRQSWPLVAAVAGGLVGATALAGGVHVVAGWQSTLPVVAPTLAAAGVAGVAAFRASWRVGVAGIGASTVGAAAAPVVAPALSARLVERVGDHLLGRAGIIEATPLVAPRSLAMLGPVWFVGPLLVIVPALALVVWRLRTDGWTALGGALAGLAGLATLQLRFAGEMGVVLVIAAAATLLVVGHGIAESPPLGAGTWTVGLAVFAASVVAASAVVSVTAGAALVAEERQYAAATEIEERGGGPVLTNWGDARLYNGLVNGESESYTRSYRHFEAVVRDERPPPDSVRWVVVDQRRLVEGYSENWHAGEAELVWRNEGVAVYRRNA